MDISFKFLLQSSRVLSDNIYDQRDLNSIYDFVISIDNKELNDYLKTKTIFSYKNDLELYIEVSKRLLEIYEEKEMYEYCHEIKKKLDECNELIKVNKPFYHE